MSKTDLDIGKLKPANKDDGYSRDRVTKISTDEGKLVLAGTGIYKYDEGKMSEDELFRKYNAKELTGGVSRPSNPELGFGAYALQDATTGEIVISFVGTQPSKDSFGDLKTDGALGLYNMLHLNLTPDQVEQANKFYEQVRKDHPNVKITIIGHSLGGGLANDVAVRHRGDNIEVLTLNPAPIPDKDVKGNVFDMENIRNVINKKDPLHIVARATDMVIPGKIYMMPNDERHSEAFRQSEFDNDRKLIRFQQPADFNDTGLDNKLTPLELCEDGGILYEALTGNKSNKYIEGLIASSIMRHPIVVEFLMIRDAPLLVSQVKSALSSAQATAIQFYEDVVNEISKTVDVAKEEVVEFSTQAISKIGDAVDAAKEEVVEFGTQAIGKIGDAVDAVKEEVVEFGTQAISKIGDAVGAAKEEVVEFSTLAINEIGKAVDAAIDLIETRLATCKEKVLEVLKAAFNAAIDFFAGALMVYLNPGEIMAIAREVAPSLLKDIVDVFKGDFVIDTNITAVVESHIRGYRQSLLTLFMSDSRKGVDRSLLGEISKDVKELAKDLSELKEDVSSAVTSMIAKDGELGTVAYY
ncbi:lipase [Bacillus sp. FJAT-51639]|uniref:Lipase n=1 Tax=Bacillus bruguierae TaxID=3127667 RepID=A0ABU8FKJ2_9BACI